MAKITQSLSPLEIQSLAQQTTDAAELKRLLNLLDDPQFNGKTHEILALRLFIKNRQRNPHMPILAA